MHQSAQDILTGLREIIDEADGPVLPTTVRSSSNISGNDDYARMTVYYSDANGSEVFEVLILRANL